MEDDVRIAALTVEVRHLTEQVEEIKKDVKEMRTMVERYKGGFLLIASVGAAVGWAASLWEKIKWPGH